MENQTPVTSTNVSDTPLPAHRKNFFQKFSRSQKVSFVTLAFIVIILPVATVLSMIATRLSPKAYLPSTPPITMTPTPTKCTVVSFNATRCDSQKTSNSYRSAKYTCGNGVSGSVDLGKCTTQTELREQAEISCSTYNCSTKPTSTPVQNEISCSLEIYKATSNSANPYSYDSQLDQNNTKIKAGDYYLYALRVFNNSQTKTLGSLKVSVTQQHQGAEPIEIINSDGNCTIDKTNKTLSCNVPNSLGPKTSALTSAGHVIKILQQANGDPKTSSVYKVSSSLGTTSCANMLFYATTTTLTPTPTTKNYLPVITNNSLPAGSVRTSYSAKIQATDANKNDNLTMTITGLPFGVYQGACVEPVAGGTVSCSISGTPTKAGTYTVQVTVTDDKGGRTYKSIGLSILSSKTPTPLRTPTSAPAYR